MNYGPEPTYICRSCGGPSLAGSDRCAQCASKGSLSTGCWVGIAVAGFLFLSFAAGLVAVGVWVVNKAQSEAAAPVAGSPTPRGHGAARARSGADASDITSWSGNAGGSGFCLADANGDGVADVIGYAGELTAIEIGSGKILWRSALAGSPVLFCDGKSGVISYREAELKVSGVNALTGAEVWTAQLSDKLDGASFGAGCTRVRSIDNAVVDMDLKTGAPHACNGGGKPPKRYGAPESVAFGGGEIRVGESKGAGTHKLLVTGPSWETALANTEAELGSRAVPAVSGSHVYVVGKKHGGRGLVVTMLDARTGAIVATREDASIGDHDQAFFYHLTVSGSTVLVESFGVLHAYGARDLTTKWAAGRMWLK